MTPTGFTPIRTTLQLEHAALFALGIAAYSAVGLGWWVFAVLLLAPDLAMLGYLRGPRLGALCYNVAHTYLSPLALAGAGWWADARTVQAVALIWVIHIAMDRTVGYGLKYASGFKDTHLQRV